MVTLTVLAQHLWDGSYFRQHFPGHMRLDDRPGAPDWSAYWDGEQSEAGRFIYGYRSLWLSERLLQPGRIDALVDALVTASRFRYVENFFDKGLEEGLPDARSRTRDTAMNPHVLDAFALAILGAGRCSAYPGMQSESPNPDETRPSCGNLTRQPPHSTDWIPVPIVTCPRATTSSQIGWSGIGVPITPVWRVSSSVTIRSACSSPITA